MYLCACVSGRGRKRQNERERERVHRFRGNGEIGVFTAIIVNTHPLIGMKRSLIKTESGWGVVG